MITKIGKMALAEKEIRLSDDEADAMRKTHLMKGLVGPFVAGPIGGIVGAGVGALAGLPFGNPDAGMTTGMILGHTGAQALGIRHLLNYGASKEDLIREKKRAQRIREGKSDLWDRILDA